MRSRQALGATLVLLVLTAAARADDLDCGAPAEAHVAADRELAKAITSPKAGAGADGALREAVGRLRAQGVSNAMIVDHAVAAYCPLVAKDEALSLARKREDVRRFAADLTSYVYDPAQAQDAIIVSVPVPPALSAQIDAAAAEAGQTRDAWLTQALAKAVAGP